MQRKLHKHTAAGLVQAIRGQGIPTYSFQDFVQLGRDYPAPAGGSCSGNGFPKI
jgi:hypothetical protein